MRQRDIGNGLDLLHPIDCSLDFKASTLLAIVSLGPLLLRSSAVDEVADLVSNDIHDRQQRLVRSLLVTTEELHHSGNFVVHHNGQTKSRS